jgi:hypothetical protein
MSRERMKGTKVTENVAYSTGTLQKSDSSTRFDSSTVNVAFPDNVALQTLL